MPTPLEAAIVDLDRTTVAALGDSFIYTPAGGQPTPAVGFVDVRQKVANPNAFGAGAAAWAIVVQLPVADFPVQPSDACRITGITMNPGAVYKPIPVEEDNDETGGFWTFELKRVPA